MKSHEPLPYDVRTHVTILTTNPDDLPMDDSDILDKAIPSANTQAQNLRKAFHIIGALIGNGQMHVNFADELWAEGMKVAALTVSQALNDY